MQFFFDPSCELLWLCTERTVFVASVRRFCVWLHSEERNRSKRAVSVKQSVRLMQAPGMSWI